MKRNSITKKRKRAAAGLCAAMICAAGMALPTNASLIGKKGEAYTDEMENFLAGLVPAEGLTIQGRTYDYWDVLGFLEEVRWAPDDYVHKNHTCVLSQLPEEDVRSIVAVLRLLMNCPKTYADYETVAKVQAALIEEGYDCGYVDGILGEMTYAALNELQEEHELRVINAVTDEVLEVLELKPED
ncbi:MAG: peptidoglycan-binding domain-containing protein [Lachnospiraceae bacterium]|nr:peptidoglycan-binding domain-containing protein [Lachnospiraceae bacterium]